MKKQKMSLEKMRDVLSNVLSRDQMKEVMAGSGGGSGQVCGTCSDQWGNWYCYIIAGTGNCRCYGVPNGSAC